MRAIFRRITGAISYRFASIQRRGKQIIAPLSPRERIVYGGIFVLILAVVMAPRVVANIADIGSVFSVSANQCSGDDAWLNVQHVTDQPSIKDASQRSQITGDNAAAWSGTTGSLECSGFAAFDEQHAIVNSAVGISLKAITQEIEDLEPQIASSSVASLDGQVTRATRLEERTDLIEPNLFGQEQPTASVDRLLVLHVSSNDGQTWLPLHEFETSLVSAQTTNINIALPPQFTIDPANLSFRLEAVQDNKEIGVFVDSIFWTYEVGSQLDISTRFVNSTDGNTITDDLPVLNQDEEIALQINMKNPNDGLFQGLANKADDLIGNNARPELSMKARLLDAGGNEVNQFDATPDYIGTNLSNADTWETPIAIQPIATDPGLYTLDIQLETDDGNVATISQNFLWGVLAMNTNRDAYRAGEEATIGMTVLDEKGATVCDAEVALNISGPGQNRALSLNNGVSKSASCEQYGSQITPDYFATHIFESPGDYKLTLTATTKNGTYSITNYVTVAESLDLVVERIGPTRIFPVVDYPMRFRLSAPDGFSGVFTEAIPIEFIVTEAPFMTPYNNRTVVGEQQQLHWDVDLAAGESIELGYSFDAPNISPEFYLFGPAVAYNTDQSVFYKEQRQWQIAGDAVDVFRTTTYEIQAGQFTGTSYTLDLNNDLALDYFPIIVGPSDSATGRSPDEDAVRITGDPHSNFSTVTATNQVDLTRGDGTNDWIGTVTLVECLLQCDTIGFELSEVLETSLAAGAANSQQTVTDTLATNYTSNTVPFAGLRGGGITTTGVDANAYATTLGVKVSKVNSNEIQFDRYGSENRVPAASTINTFIVEWGSEWTVQEASVTGVSAGSGLDAIAEWDSNTINPVIRNNTWVWGNGFTRDDGLGDGALGQVITLGDGVTENSSESLVSVGGEGALIVPGRDFQVYVMEHAKLAVDYRFKTRGDNGPGNGFQELNITIDAEVSSELYDNSATDVQYTEGRRFPLLTTTSGGTGQAYSRTGAWATRISASTNLNYFRAYAGQPVTGWAQIVDFGNLTFSNTNTHQEGFRWRDDTTDLDTSGGWIATENTNPAAQDKLTNLRLRIRTANHGTTPEEAARTYELQFASKFGFGSCAEPLVWTGIEDSPTDEFEMYLSDHIEPDGESTATSHLTSGGFTYVNGEARESIDTTGTIGPMGANSYAEIEYTVRPTTETITGRSYCFRLYDATADSVLDTYDNFPEITIGSTTNIVDNGLGEVGTFTSQVNGGWTTINFDKSYTTPVVVGVPNTHDNQNALVFEVDNVTASSADMRVCESEGSTSNGCDTHAAETVGYMVIDAAVAATTSGIEAGTFTVNGQSDANTVTTNFAESFTSTPYVFANVNTVNSTQFPIETVITTTSAASFSAGICDHLQGSVDSCDGSHGNETVGWVAIEPSNEPFREPFDNDSQVVNANNGAWTGISFSETYSGPPVVLLASQTDTGAQDVEIEAVNNVTLTGADIRFCEIDASDTCDTHSSDTMVWHAMEAGVIDLVTELDQDGFRFYENTNAIQPTTALGDEDMAIANVDNGDVLRIRLALQNSDAQNLPTGGTDLTLQYAQATDCASAGAWTDVGGIGSGQIWRGFNNAAPADETPIAASLLDSSGNTLMTYEEENDSAGNVNQLNRANRGEWDWVIENNGAANFTSYCFRVITTGDETLHYSLYPRLTTSSGEAPLDPSDPASLAQEKTGGTSLSVGDPTNESTVNFTANISDGNTNDILELCVEVVAIGVAFTNTETNCGNQVVYSGSAVAAEVSIAGLSSQTNYHWQARVRDAAGAYSNWVSFGGNGESETDFSIDTDPPVLNVFDGTTTGIDVEYNNGSLDELSANWDIVEGIQPDSLSQLSVWLDGDDVNGTGTDPADGSSITTWTDKSGNGNDIAGTGDATFDASEQAVAFSDDVQPFDDTYDRSGGDANSMTIFAVVQGNGTTSNNVWYETTTPRVAPAENGLLGGGTSLTNNHFWSSHITDTKVMTLEYLSTGTSTAWLNRNQEQQFTETQAFANTQRLVIGDDTTGGNRLETGEFVHEIIIYNSDLSTSEREDIWRYLECKWNLVDCSITYERSIGTSPGGTDVLNWTSSNTATSSTDTSLNLTTSQPYYYNIRATDAAGNQTIFSSDGQFVAPTLSVSISSTELDLGHANSGNNLTVTGDTTITTSTNAYNGYTVRAYATGFLTKDLDTISMFDGGTYAAPDGWQTGDTGYGYTSSDTLVQGVNLFHPATCIGGNSSPCYAPFSLSAPGDIVADHTSTVSGTPISNEQFIITHRVTVDNNQIPGDYTTLVVYNVTARY